MKQKILFVKAAVLATVIIAATLGSWEMYLRHQGRGISYDDGGSLWSDKRKQVYEPKDKATVFIGSSRIKYDLDIPTWESITGNHAIQLANVGSSPLPVLNDLAADEQFKGRLVIDVTEFLFFQPAPYVNKTPVENLEYFKKETPAQKVGFALNKALESEFLFLDKEEYSLNALLASTRIPNRPNVYEFPDFPEGFTPVSFDRQSYMTENFVKDTNLINQVTAVWAMFGEAAAKMPPITEAQINATVAAVKAACHKIQSRGGEVIFVRTPSSGPMLAMEKMAFPKERFWNKLLAATGCRGIHFEDYPQIAHFQCPEFSHLSVPQAKTFTEAFINILREKGWSFQTTQNTIALN
ncbi:hypothetical protein EXU57_10230 [Segetibacter sp. 3557_3]|uniref:hypothetical protein n=1 Tax=Segetibacter sp. 3557_3 TaxID=2547429 RepID=UPI0010590C1A|nr:hypothetical protein [Segetibacter sp. 3557_3]TDH26465.1 hypothetical protein EXU57_10230 [Segetibacter sp. 3557_3]